MTGNKGDTEMLNNTDRYIKTPPAFVTHMPVDLVNWALALFTVACLGFCIVFWIS